MSLLQAFHNAQMHEFAVRVYYEDTDFASVVYHANYLKFLERGRSEFLRALGVNQLRLAQEESVHFVVHHMDIAFKKPAQMDDLLTVQSAFKEIKGARFLMEQHLYRETLLLLKANVSIALVDKKGMPQRLSMFF